MKKIDEIQKELINKIKEEIQKVIITFNKGKLSERNLEIINEIYKKNNARCMIGK